MSGMARTDLKRTLERCPGGDTLRYTSSRHGAGSRLVARFISAEATGRYYQPGATRASAVAVSPRFPTALLVACFWERLVCTDRRVGLRQNVRI